MFNHECTQRGGEVVGACMDGFLFGACCQLKSDSQSHIPKGPGVVMTSYLDYPDAETTDDYDVEEMNAWHNSFKPVVTPGYRPDKTTTEEPNTQITEGEEIISEGLSQITNTLLSTPPKDNNFIYIHSKPDYTHSTVDHGGAETILIHTNGSIVDTIVRPSDFNVHISSMQTKPTVPPSTSSSSPPKTSSTHRPVFNKPIFKPKPMTSTTENYVMVPTITRETPKPELSSIDSILQMLNDSSPSIKEDAADTLENLETKTSPSTSVYTSPITLTTNFYSTPGHYVTLKPSTFYSSSSTTKPFTNKKPSHSYTTPNSIPQQDKPTSRPFVPSQPSTQSTSEEVDAFNRYPTNPNDFGDKVTTFTFVSSTTTTRPTTTRRAPSTSYVTGAQPSLRPVTAPTAIPSFELAPDTFSSVTPTVIVLGGFQSTKPEPDEKEPSFVEISQAPFKKPINQITVNNHIASTNNIYMGKPPPSYERPASPTIVITPKPAPTTTPYPIKASARPVPIATTNFDTEYYSPTTLKTELQTSPDDLINFPPVRNPMLNATGSNPGLYNTSVAISDNDLDILHDIEFTTPTWQEDAGLKDKMSLFVNKIVSSLQGTFQELHDIVILNKKSNLTSTTTTTQKPKKTIATTKRPLITTKKPTRVTTSTRRPLVKTTKRPTKLTTPAKRTTTTSTTKRPVSNRFKISKT